MTKNLPIIGILPDYQIGGENTYSKKNFYAIRENYVSSINKNHGNAIILTYNYQAIDQYIDMIDGLMVVGGYMDINPNKYGETEIHPTVKLNPTRENFEFEIVKKILKTSMPIFGICNGMQLINVLHSGTIFQHLPDNPKFMDHEQSHFAEFKEYGKSYHKININTNTNFYKITNATSTSTNSSHHQAINKLGNNLNVCATTEDGIIEAYENPNHPFCIGVQWHPEFMTSEIDNKLFQEFINKTTIYKQNKNINVK